MSPRVLAARRQSISFGSARRPISSFLHSAIQSPTSLSPSERTTAAAFSAPSPGADFLASADQAPRMLSLICVQSASVTVRPQPATITEKKPTFAQPSIAA